MTVFLYSGLKEKAAELARRLGAPSFYALHRSELEASFISYSENPMISSLREHLGGVELHPAHGMTHGEKVALEAGAILNIEAGLRGIPSDRIGALTTGVHIAGLLHDIKRLEENHPEAGSREAQKILRDFDLEPGLKNYIADAIRNHEAFKEVLASEDEAARLLSDSLYDADKFRWGPDNFTATLWLILESTRMPLKDLYHVFPEKMEGIKKIKYTFRTDTGKKYGPEFIDLGARIGTLIYSEIERMIEKTI